MSIGSYGEGFDDYEGRPLDEWAPPSSIGPWPSISVDPPPGWDPYFDLDLEALTNHAWEIAEALEAAGVTAVETERLKSLVNTRGSFVDEDATRSLGEAPYQAIVLTILDTDHAKVVARHNPGSGSAMAEWTVLDGESPGVDVDEPTDVESTDGGSPAPERVDDGAPTPEPTSVPTPSEQQAAGPWFDRAGAAEYLG
ncbi:MAG: hypothetical protein ACOYOQ_15255, partial [Microthrixaceae bacterium]